jgi:hypothetical protein
MDDCFAVGVLGYRPPNFIIGIYHKRAKDAMIIIYNYQMPVLLG